MAVLEWWKDWHENCNNRHWRRKRKAQARKGK